MATARILPVYDDFLELPVSKATPEEILAFRIPEAPQRRADELADRHKEGRLRPEELAELEPLLELDERVSLLKAKALKTLKAS